LIGGINCKLTFFSLSAGYPDHETALSDIRNMLPGGHFFRRLRQVGLFIG
jgi:hypothetical protein